MRLLCVTPSYWPAIQYGGPVVSVHGLNRVLAKKGVDVTVYTTNAGLGGKVPVNQEVQIDKVRVTYFGFTSFFEFMGSTGWQFSMEMTDAIRRTLKTFDIIHINGLWNYPVAVTAHYCRKYEKPYILSLQGMFYPYTLAKKAWKKWPYYKLITKRDIQNAAAIHCLTEYEKSKSHSIMDISNRLFVIPNGVDLSGFDDLSTGDNLRDRFPMLKNKKVILFLGRINWIKGLDILSQSFGKIARERDDLHMLIVGPDEGGYKKKVIKWLENEGISKHVTFTGMLKGKEKLEAFKGSDIFVLPSYSEGFSMSTLEAMYCRLPVIISDQCHFPEIAQYDAGKVISCDFNQLAQAMEQLIDNEELRKKMGENGRKLIESKFSWDKVAVQMIEAYEDIIKTWKSKK